jgi:hypothetical protein
MLSPPQHLKLYVDTTPDSGATLERYFCSGCGSSCLRRIGGAEVTGMRVWLLWPVGHCMLGMLEIGVGRGTIRVHWRRGGRR